MGSKVVITFLEIFLQILLIISPQVVFARELQISRTIALAKEGISYKPLNPKGPFCNEKIYANCIPRPEAEEKKIPFPPERPPPCCGMKHRTIWPRCCRTKL